MKHSSPALLYWLEVVARYVRLKRAALGKTQDDLAPIARATVSRIEGAQLDFRLGTLLTLLEKLESDVSEVFQARISPTSPYAGHNRHLHEMLAELTAFENPVIDDLIDAQLEALLTFAREQQKHSKKPPRGR